MSGDERALPPDTVAAIEARAAEIAAALPPPTDEQLTALRRWFGPRAVAEARARAEGRSER